MFESTRYFLFFCNSSQLAEAVVFSFGDTTVLQGDIDDNENRVDAFY